MLSWQSILRIGCQTERLAQLRAFAIIGVILLQRRSRITMPPCEYFTLFYIQCGVYTEFGIEPRNKFTLSIRTVKSGSVSHFQFSILFCSAVLCCNIYSFLLCSGLLYCTVLFSALLYSSVLFSALWIFRTINPVHCVLSRQEIAISRQEIRNAGRTHQIPPITNA